jgi:pyruvate-formate lyase-activating enzyme
MNRTIELPNPEVALTLDELSAFQNVAATHLTFSLTLSCPLRCAHCIVDASPDKKSTTMPLEVAEYYATQMGDLAEYGIRSVSFTGGEPFVAREQLKVLSDAAAEVGITCGVVSAAPWARTRKSAERTVAAFPGIKCWDISVDTHHLPFVSREDIRRAYDALLAAGHRVTIRFAYMDPPSEADMDLLAFISELDQARFAAQRIRGVGRGALLGIEPGHRYNAWVKPCLTQGMVVRYDGTISPCCLNLVEARSHPFQLGDARVKPLTELHAEYLAQPLLQLIRSVGLRDLYDWIKDAGLDSRLPALLPDEACEICELFMKDNTIASYLKQRAEEPAMQLKIALVTYKTLGESQLLAAVLERFRDDHDDIEGWDLAQEFYDEIAGVAR